MRLAKLTALESLYTAMGEPFPIYVNPDSVLTVFSYRGATMIEMQDSRLTVAEPLVEVVRRLTEVCHEASLHH